MQPTSFFNIFYLTHLSKPHSDRLIYRAIIRGKARHILELGIADAKRALRMIDAATRFAPRAEIQYVGMDPFEDRNKTDGPGLTLITAHRVLKHSGARIKLIPGDPLENIRRLANNLGQFDLMIISPGFDSERLKPVWFFVPRLLYERSLVFLERQQPDGVNALKVVSRREIDQLAAKAIRWKAA